MLIEIFGICISLFVSIYFLILCTAKKKKTTHDVGSYTSRDSGLSDHPDIELAGSLPASDTTSNSQQRNATLSNHNEEKRVHSQSQASQGRELPHPPTKEETSAASQRNSMDRNSRNSTEVIAAGPGENDASKHHSPKGRRLPAPPPEDALKSTTDNQEQADEDPYASVDDDKDDKKKSEVTRFKVKTLDFKEGSGDSTFYAKVTDGPEDEGDTDLYAQVDDKVVEVNGDAKSPEEAQNPSPSTSKSAPVKPGAYPTPEYASIDRGKKGLSIKRPQNNPQTSTEPPAPPIPVRNFDAEDEPKEGPQDEEAQEQNTAEDEKVPKYESLVVRESLEHLRKRETVEKERREKYENLPCINGGGSSSDLYAQIDENNAEAVYESLSQPGSADGTYGQANNTNPDYSSISELNGPSSGTSFGLQVRPQRQHHYEMIEQPGPST